MNILQIKKLSNHNYYTIGKETNKKIEMLGEFLLDCGSDIEEIKIMINKYNTYNADATLTELQGNIITISHWYLKYTDFIIQYDTFLKFLDEWKAVYQTKPSEIIITMDDQHQHFTIQAIP